MNFYKEGLTQARVTLEWEVFGAAALEAHSTFKGAKAGMTQGWTGSLDHLDEYLKKSD